MKNAPTRRNPTGTQRPRLNVASPGRGRRWAHVCPRLLAAVMVLILFVAGCLTVTHATAATLSKPTLSTATLAKLALHAGPHSNAVPDWRKLPEMVEAYGVRRAVLNRKLAAQSKANAIAGSTLANSGLSNPAPVHLLTKSLVTTFGGVSPAGGGAGQLPGSGLIEVDITAHEPGDKREPAESPAGNYIAFASTGSDPGLTGKITALDSNGKYHIWIMDLDGTNERQITGLGGDAAEDQRHPVWSPDGNTIAYTDDAVPASPQIFEIAPFAATAAVQVTYFPGMKGGVAWSGSDDTLAFDSEYDPIKDVAQSNYNIFTMNADGGDFQRVTGGTGDPVGESTNDMNPAFSQVSPSVVFFSSNRDSKGVLAGGGRRIWGALTNGTNIIQVTDPTQRPAGKITDIDDNPALSLNGLENGDTSEGETLAFQSNSLIDSSDATADLNVWSVPVDSTKFIPSTDLPLTFVGNWNAGTVEAFDAFTGIYQKSWITGLNNPEDIIAGTKYMYVSDRNNNQICRYNTADGSPAGVIGAVYISNAGLTTGPMLSSCEGLAIHAVGGTTYLYVATGPQPFQVSASTPAAVFRYDLDHETPAPGTNQKNAQFTFGEAKPLTGGMEEITFDPSGNLYASCFYDNEVNVYNGATGAFIESYVTAGENGLSGPTGLAFGPDVAKDGATNCLFVSSTGALAVPPAKPTNSIKVYTLVPLVPNGLGKYTPGSPVVFAPGFPRKPVLFGTPGAIDFENGGDGLLSVERIAFDTLGTPAKENCLYATNFEGGLGTNVVRFDATTGEFVPLPGEGNSNYLLNDVLSGPTGIAFNDLAFSAPSAKVAGPFETATNPSTELTNYTSSPTSFTNSGLAGLKIINNATTPETQVGVAGEDKAADTEPAWSTVDSPQTTASTIYFSSARLFAPQPTLDQSSGNPTSGTTVVFYENSSGAQDIWTTGAYDTTPPTLVPQSVGNIPSPLIAPDDNLTAGLLQPGGTTLLAPRTPTGGLVPSGQVTFAFVVKETQSGLASATVTYYNADDPTFTNTVDRPNDQFTWVNIAQENRPLPFAEAGITYANMPITGIYDDGPVSSGGHEIEGGAVAGDGNYYCQGTLATPKTAGDYYIDITLTDQAGNSLTYDNIWGFSTKAFSPTPGNDLFVSDYTAGQQFPFTVTNDPRFDNMNPVESYWLSNPGGESLVEDSLPPYSVADPYYFAELVSTESPNTLINVDVWRVQCRGELPQSVIQSYTPAQIPILDPTLIVHNPQGGPPVIPPASKITVSASKCIIWADPYAGTAFACPGTLLDSVMQTRLLNFLSSGGRLFLSGRSILWALTNDGSTSNAFVQSGLQTSWDNEGTVEVNHCLLDEQGGNFSNPDPYFTVAFDDPHYVALDLQIGHHNDNPEETIVPNNGSEIDYDWLQYDDDGLTLDDEEQGFNSNFDFLGAGTGASNVTTVPSYTIYGTPVGERVQEVQSNGLTSKVVDFGFGLEGVNNYWNLGESANERQYVATSVRQYMKTSSITGQVDNQANDLPIPGFVVQAVGGGVTRFAVTDQFGNYRFDGLEEGGWTVQPASEIANPNQLVNQQYYSGTAEFEGVLGGTTTNGVNFRVLETPPGTLTGQGVSSNGNGSLVYTATDSNLPVGFPVLLQSTTTSPLFPNSGHFAELSYITAGGKFAFSGVPTNTGYNVFFNPRISDFAPEESTLITSYEADQWGGPDPNLGERELPGPTGNYTISIPPGGTWVLNNDINDTAADSGVPVVVPEGINIPGTVTVDQVPFSGATVTLLTSSGTPVGANFTVTTASNGTYVIPDVVPGSYLIEASVTLPTGTATLKGPITVLAPTETGTDVNGVLLTPNYNFPIVVNNLQGTVTVNGTLTSGATVTLLQNNGSPFSPPVTATTGAAGVYNFATVVTGSYKIEASFGGTTSLPIPLTVVAGTPPAGLPPQQVPVIALTSQLLSGTVYLNGVGSPGASLQLLSSTGTPFVPPVTTTSGAGGKYSFSNVTPGTYEVQASQDFDSQTTAPFVVTAGVTTIPNIFLVTQNVSGTVLGTTGSLDDGVTVQLLQAGVVKFTGTTAGTGANAGAYNFTIVPVGVYTVHAFVGTLVGTSSATVTRGVNVVVPPITLEVGSFAPTDPTQFTTIGKIYTISIPYEDTGSPTTNNVSEPNPATTTVAKAFTIPPVDPNTGAINYLLQSWNPTTRAYVTLGNNSTISRGAGYLLQVVNTPTALVLPAGDPTRTPLNATVTTFTVTLHRNMSAASDPNDGLNLIGFGFNPAFSTASWTNAKVIYNGTTYASVTAAAAAGIISANLTTVDPTAASYSLVPTSSIAVYGGFYARTNYDGVQVVFSNPTP